MDFWDLRCFVATAEELSFTHAAQRLFISQQTLSARISRLEQQYQTKLFERTTPLKLTPAGEYLFKQARVILRFQASIDSGIQSIRKNGNSVLSIGVIVNRATIIIQRAIPAFQLQYPDVGIRVIEIFDADLPSALQTQPIDLLLCYELNSSATTFIPLYDEQYYICIPDSILTAYFSEDEKKRILSQQTAQISDFVHCPALASHQINFLTDVFKKCCTDAGVIPQVFVESSSVMTRLSLCISGLGIMFLSKSLYQQAESLFNRSLFEKVHFFPIDYQPEFTYRRIGINYLTKKGLGVIGQNFARTAQTLLAQEDACGGLPGELPQEERERTQSTPGCYAPDTAACKHL